jgi:hypothetical protein
VDLARRAARILQLPNTTVEQRDLAAIPPAPALVMRAVLPLSRAVPVLGGLLEPGGRAVVGWSRTETNGNGGVETVPEVGGVDCSTVRVPSEILDETASLLIMSRRGT